MAEATQVVERHVGAFNARHADADPWGEGAEFVAPGASMRGREDVLGFLMGFCEAFPDTSIERIRAPQPSSCPSPGSLLERRADENFQ